MKNLTRISTMIIAIVSLYSCEEKPVPPTVTTTEAIEISYTTATSGGNVTDEGGASIITKGICWSTSTSPTIDNNKTTESPGVGTFTSALTDLTPNTTYYVKAYATNTAGTGYGSQVSFTTLQVEVPELTTAEVTSITQITAVSGGNITDDNGSTITERGVCWSTSANPTIANNKTIDGSGTGTFTSNLTDLQPGTVYNVRAYATNSEGTAYGNMVSFTTNSIPVTGVTLDITSAEIRISCSKQLTAILEPSNASNKNVTWSSSNTSVATVSSTGLVTAIEEGEATITVTTEDGSFEATCTVEVLPYFNAIGETYLAVDGLTVTLNSFTITESTGSYKYKINYTLVNNTTDQAIDEGTFKMYYANKTGGKPQYGFFGTLYPGGSTTKSYTFEELKSDPFGVLEYHHDNFFSNNPIDESLKWEVDINLAINPAELPILTTSNISSILPNSASSGGNITSDGGTDIIARGVCWSHTSYPPTIEDSKTTDGNGTGEFTSSITGLTPGDYYRVRAYATNSEGTGYGKTIYFKTQFPITFNSNLTYETVTDIDGNEYKTIIIGTQTWMAENLKTTKYNDGTDIPLVTDKTEWAILTTPGYCWYDNNGAYFKAIFGALYNWYAVNTGNLCPTGWHVPSDTEWCTLTSYLGGEDIAGGKLKEIGSTHWDTRDSPNMGATNESGFTALPGGRRSDLGSYNYFNSYVGTYGYWWSSTQEREGVNFIRHIGVFYTKTTRNFLTETYGVSVRCIKD